MSAKKNYWIGLLIVAVFIKVFSLFPNLVERYYSNGLYLAISKVQRILFGWAPISIGDLFYAAIIIWLIIKLFRFIRSLRQNRSGRALFIHLLKRLTFVALHVYIVFNICWGLNYNRVGIADHLSLKVERYTEKELTDVVELIVKKLNDLDSIAPLTQDNRYTKKNLFAEAFSCYQTLGKRNPNFTYRVRSVKPSIYSYLGNYMGFTGYYNPFSGEAQVNTTVPVYLQPFTTCHEIGHQLGYAKENEANFAAFLSARTSSDMGFRYSVYFDLYAYSRRYLYQTDSLLLKSFDERLRPGVRSDFRELRKFWEKYANPAERVIDRFYNEFLKANQQPLGRQTYSEVIGWLIAYYKKYGAAAV